MNALKTISFLLVIIGALNWGLVGLGYFFGFDGNLVNMLLGAWPAVEAIVYVLVGLGALVLLWARASRS